jgi:hypothetical protein
VLPQPAEYGSALLGVLFELQRETILLESDRAWIKPARESGNDPAFDQSTEPILDPIAPLLDPSGDLGSRSACILSQLPQDTPIKDIQIAMAHSFSRELLAIRKCEVYRAKIFRHRIGGASKVGTGRLPLQVLEQNVNN